MQKLKKKVRQKLAHSCSHTTSALQCPSATPARGPTRPWTVHTMESSIRLHGPHLNRRCLHLPPQGHAQTQPRTVWEAHDFVGAHAWDRHASSMLPRSREWHFKRPSKPRVCFQSYLSQPTQENLARLLWEKDGRGEIRSPRLTSVSPMGYTADYQGHHVPCISM